MRRLPSLLRLSLTGLLANFAVACDGSFSTPGGHPVPPGGDTSGGPGGQDTTSPRPDASDTYNPRPDVGPNDATNRPDAPAPVDSANGDTRPTGDSSGPDTRPDTGPSAEPCDPDHFVCASDDTIEYCDNGSLRSVGCLAVCRDSGHAVSNGCGFDGTFGGDVCWCDDLPEPPVCEPSTCAESCRVRGLEPRGCTAGACECAPKPNPDPTCAPTGWACSAGDLTFCDGASTDRWDCDDVCHDLGYAYASSCGYDSASGDEACFCEDNACTGGGDLCLANDYLETCSNGAPAPIDCWDVCRDAGYDQPAGCGYDAGSNQDSCFCENVVCQTGDLVCADGACIAPAYVCDGIDDCASGDDEWGCTPACDPNEAWCTSDYTIEVCDAGYPVILDCDDFCRSEGYDYAEGCGYDSGYGGDVCVCTFEGCYDFEFQCNDGLCLDEVYVCDGYSDCGAGEDEWGCF